MKQQDNGQLPDFKIVGNKAGTFSLQQISSGEIMHSVSDPLDEARHLYAGQINWGAIPSPVVVWDVGLGGAANVAALAECFPKPEFQSAVVVSFETAPEGLQMALASPHQFPYLAGLPAGKLLKEGIVKDAPWGSWSLVSDVFQAPSTVPAPAVIFYDMFSINHRPEHWGICAFTYLRECCERAENPGGTILITHSRSTPVRTAMMLAGWEVGLGVASGPKADTTLAVLGGAADRWLAKPFRPLGEDWLQRWERSQQPLPADYAGTRESARPILTNKIKLSKAAKD